MLVRALLLCAAAVDGLAAKKGSAVKGGTSKPAGGGFGAPSDKKPVALTAAQLLNRADKRYDELEAKYALHDTLVFRDYVVTVRVPADDTTALASQLRDWVPVACLGVADARESKTAVPIAIATYRREIVEIAKMRLGGAAANAVTSSPAIEFAYEPIEAWHTRVLETVRVGSSAKKDALGVSAKTLRLSDDQVDDIAAVKDAYKVAMRRAHPDSREVAAEGETAPTLSEVKAAYEKLSDALAKQSSAAGAYTSIGGKARDFGTVRNAKREADIEAAVVALQTDYVTMFLARNVQKAAAAQRESAAALAEAL
mmetsp:Transcript_23742/g.84733  ORF Transcript_23742/g.84733 Transcript_23742/m.84733 type:complete len:312 (+) Transcript_23742:107-1042(+)